MARELDLWGDLYRLCSEHDNPKVNGQTFSDAQVASVYLWSVAHDRPVCWACDAANWLEAGGVPAGLSPLPSQPTVSRRVRTDGVRGVLDRVWAQLAGMTALGACAAKLIDGLPLPVGPWSKDRRARRGWGARGLCRGYKLHVVWAWDGHFDGRDAHAAALPLRWDVRPMNDAECRVALQLVRGLPGDGYLIGDSQFDTNDLHDESAANGHLLLAPRKRPGRALGAGYQSPYRLLCLSLMEPGDFGRHVPRDLACALRKRVDRRFGNLTCRGGGLGSTTLPAWVRTPTRVRLWVMAKLLLNAAHVRVREREARDRRGAAGAGAAAGSGGVAA